MSTALPDKVRVLPTEIWRQIFFLLYWADYHSLKSCALINHKLHEIAASILFRTLQLRVAFCGRIWRLEDVSNIPWKHVKVIVVTGIDLHHGIGDWEKVGLLKAIESATSLQEFHWRHYRYMPGFALLKLHQLHPHVAVHITGMNVCLAQRRRPHHPIERSIPYLECLNSLTSEWEFKMLDSVSKPPTNTSSQARLKDIICASRNLKSLTLIQRAYGSWPPPRGMITLQKGDVLPNLKHLHLANMYLDPTQSLLWVKSLQWESLESLSLVNGEWGGLVPGIEDRLTGLKSFEVSLSESYPKLRYWWIFDGKIDPPPLHQKRAAQVRQLLESMPLLESFSGYFLPQSILDTLSKIHRDSLKHLRFRSFPRGHKDPNELPWPSSIENLESLPDRFPNLQTLGLDLDWINEEWPYETMAHIRGLKYLKHLEINLPSISSVRSSRKPDFGVLGVNRMDDDACQRLVRFFQSGPDRISLNSLHIKIGEWENAKWTSRSTYPRNDPLIIGERDDSGSMHFYRVNPPVRHKGPFEDRVKHYGRDLYRGLLEIHGIDDPGFVGSVKVPRGILDSAWTTSS